MPTESPTHWLATAAAAFCDWFSPNATLPDASSRSDTLRIAMAIAFGVGLAKIVGATLFLTPYELNLSPWRFGYETGHIAGNLASGNGFSIKMGGGDLIPTAWMSPAYPLMLSGVFRIFGLYTESAAHATVAMNGLFQGLCAGLLFWMGTRLAGAKIGALAALLMLVNPGGWQFLDWAWPTHLFALAILVHVFCLLGSGSGSRLRTGLAGVTLGLALLVDGAAITLVPVSLLVIALAGQRANATRRLATALACLCLTMAPWAARNAIELGSPNPLRGNIGLNLWVGNHPGARAESFHGISHSPWHGRAEGRQMVALGERAYDRHSLKRALAEITAKPLDFAKHTLMRFSGFWIGEWWTGFDHIPWPYSFGHLALFLIACVGIARSRHRGLGFLVVGLLMFSVPYALTVHGHGRYSFPIEPILCLFAALAFSARAYRPDTPSP